MNRALGPIVTSFLLALAVGSSVVEERPTDAVGLRVALSGAAYAGVVVARDASPAERTAANELVEYLRRVTGAPVRRWDDGRQRGAEPAIQVGPTGYALARGVDCAASGGEGWIVRSVGAHLVVCGGRPRGTLYAAYHLLEDVIGVRWWTPFDESVPEQPDLVLGPLDLAGSPSFVYRDLNGIPGDRRFCARNRLNGHFALLDLAHGGFEGYGPPRQVHDFFEYVPPDEFFEEHPEYFSEIGGMRYADGAQLCLTQPDLLPIVSARLESHVERSREDSRRHGTPRPLLFNFSQNDQGKACTCDRCSAAYLREGTRAATLIQFVNALADGVAGRYPEIKLDTLAYGFTFTPPERLTVRDNVVVRVAPLYNRDFSKPLRDPRNEAILDAIEGWRRSAKHVRVWDYAVTFGDAGDLPLPNLSFMAQNFRDYLALGVEGVFVQQDPPVGTDLQDLKLWVTIKLLEDPGRDPQALLVEFTDGYYGAAGSAIRRYVELLDEAARARPAEIGFAAGPEAFRYLDAPFLRQAQELFDEAQARLGDDPVALRRLRHARLTLDRATVYRWEVLEKSRDSGEPLTLDFEDTLARYAETWREQIERRYPAREREEALDAIEAEIDELTD